MTLSMFILWFSLKKDERIQMMYNRLVKVELQKGNVRRGRLLLRIIRNIFQPWLPGKGYMEKWERHLIQAGGFGGGWTAEEFFILRILMGAGLGFLIYGMSGNLRDSLFFSLVGFFFPAFVVWLKIKKRRKEALASLRQLLKVMLVLIEQNAHLREALEKAGKEVPGSLGEVLTKASEWLKRGESIPETFTWIKNQFGLDELDEFCMSMILAVRNGTPVVAVIREQIRTLDEDTEERVEEGIQNAQLKVSFSIMFFFFFPFFFTAVVAGALSLMIMVKS